LRSRTYGHKRDYFEKDQVHYPVDNQGVVDEWRALVKTIEDQTNKKIIEEKEVKKIQQKEYWD
jgi:hypothetical protein